MLKFFFLERLEFGAREHLGEGFWRAQGGGGAESVLFSPKPDTTHQREKNSGMNAKPLLGYRFEFRDSGLKV